MNRETMCPICNQWHKCSIDRQGRIHFTCEKLHIWMRYSKEASQQIIVWSKIRNVVEPLGATL